MNRAGYSPVATTRERRQLGAVAPMDTETEYIPCIERRTDFSRDRCSVKEYEEAVRFSRRLSRRGRMFHELGWTREAPAVEKLTTEWQLFAGVEFRIFDWGHLQHADAQADWSGLMPSRAFLVLDVATA